MRLKTYLIIGLFTFLSVKCFAQVDMLPLDESSSKKIFFSMDYRNSFIRSSEAHVIGFRAGIEVGEKYRFGVGISLHAFRSYSPYPG
jgi:hypothetical protein